MNDQGTYDRYICKCKQQKWVLSKLREKDHHYGANVVNKRTHRDKKPIKAKIVIVVQLLLNGKAHIKSYNKESVADEIVLNDDALLLGKEQELQAPKRSYNKVDMHMCMCICIF